jgi:hypothetical protein
MAAIVAPAGDCSMAMTRDCFEPRLAFLLFGSLVVCWDGFAAPSATVDEATERFFTDFDIKILRSVRAASRRTTEAPPRPSGQRGRISERPQRPELTTLPLQSRPNASPFWIMLLLSVGALEHAMIKQPNRVATWVAHKEYAAVTMVVEWWILALEIRVSRRPTKDRCGSAHTDSADERRKSAYGATERFFTDFDIKILRSVKAASAPHHRSPTSAIRPAGQDLGAPSAPGIDDTTAPIAAECQSFLDHVIAQCGHT